MTGPEIIRAKALSGCEVADVEGKSLLSRAAWMGGGLGDRQPGILPTEEQRAPAPQDPADVAGRETLCAGGANEQCPLPVPPEACACPAAPAKGLTLGSAEGSRVWPGPACSVTHRAAMWF